MAKVVYKKYEAKNLNPNYKMVDGGSPYSYSYNDSNTAYSHFTFNENDGTFTMSGSTYPSGTFYAYGGSSKNVVVEYTRYTSGGGTFPRPEKVYKSERVTPRYTKGKYIGEVTAEDGAYPRDGTEYGYWYEWDRYANRAPIIGGSNTAIGNVNNDFTISYNLMDEDNDEVKVEIMVDGKVIQYPMAMALNQSHSVPIRIKDYGLGDHTITVTATDTSNASASRTYYFTKSNTAPTISGSDMDLGAKFEDFQVDYLVQDAEGNDVSVEIKVDGTIKQSSSKSTLGVRRYFTIPIKDYEIGRHTIEIKATDSNGASTVRAYSFNKVNSAPAISGKDENLGAKNTAFSYTYTVTDRESDNIDVIEKVNGEVIRVLNNATLDSEYRITITDEQIRQLELNASNTIEIEATDGTATTFRRVTFIRNNMPPIISDKDKDLGEVTNSLEYSWSATDPEKDKMTAVIYLDDRILKDRFALAEGTNQTVKIDGQAMQKLSRGKHTIRIVVDDDKGFSSSRTLTFTRVVDKLVMKLAGNGIETDGLAKRVLISTAGVYVAKGADVKYEVCNNSFDESPTWEDATAMTMANKAFNFTNKDKTAEKAGVDIKVTISRGDAKGISYISAIGGSFD
ncbi:hypothetical protein [uncultured Anaerococcus sp.]|uniref:hypothetical protein n=1 Tax=uncultured Anaerococcus sp. TaxID=293428 RepID=UPI0025FB5499|nr:hypothetical protein [uncultured Anaerococcus sp.]